MDRGHAHARRSERRDSIADMLALAESEPGIPIMPKDLDGDPWLLNTRTAVVDLRTGKARPHDRLDYMTKLTGAPYNPKAPRPSKWLSFLLRVMDGNMNLIQFLQRWAGCCLTGRVVQKLLFCYGSGRNGKSVFLNTLQRIIGDYACKLSSDILLQKNGQTHPTELTELFQRRLAVSIEAEAGRRMAESLFKELTGGDAIRARRMREDTWEFRPTHKLVLAANHKPVIRGQDFAVWRRISLVPFLVTIPDAEVVENLEDILFHEEGSGILEWMIEGCLEWQAIGLQEPDEVKAATAGYKKESDVLAEYFEDRIIFGERYTITSKDLFSDYSEWCRKMNENNMSQTALGFALQERGHVSDRNMYGRFWRGLTTKP